MRLRRMLGLYAFFYAGLHMLTWLVLDHFFDWMEIGRDILKRSYITLGFAAFVLLIPLAATSTDAMMRRLGGRRWKRLHGTVYLIGVLAVLHFLWLVKADIRDPAAYGAALALLLGLRFPAGCGSEKARPRHRRGPSRSRTGPHARPGTVGAA